LRQDEFLARGHEEGAFVFPGPQVVEGEDLAIAVEAPLEIFRLLAAAVFDHPLDKSRLVVQRRPHVAAEGSRRAGRKGGEAGGGCADQKSASVHEILFGRRRARRVVSTWLTRSGGGRLIGGAGDKISP